jgi:hypothetical protein
MTEDAPSPLSIGAIVGGLRPRSRDWGDELGPIARRISAECEGVETPLAVNVVFHIPGEVVVPEFEGVRTGRYSKKSAHLMVQVAIPDIPLPDDVGRYLLGRIEEAIAEAEAFGQRRKLFEGRLEELRALVGRL